jgi:hypothetical protein
MSCLNHNHTWMVAALLALSVIVGACGKGGKAGKVVRNFLESHLNGAEFDILECSEVDSTTRVLPYYIAQMRQTAASKFKPAPTYVEPTPQLKYVSVKYVVGKDTVSQTFYLDQNLTGVVGVKE